MRPLIACALAAAVSLSCRGDERPDAERSSAIFTARTLGLAYLQGGQLAQAESAFRNVVTLAPRQALGHANLGLVYLRQGRYRDAESEIRRAAALDTASDDIALMLATVYGLTDRQAAARRELDAVLQRSPEDVRALHALAELDTASRDRYLARILERAPGNIAARLELVDLLLARGDAAADQAAAQLEALERQLPALPRETTRFFTQALALARAGRAAAAAAPARRFHHLMRTTAPYQASLQRLRGAGGALPGYPILTFSPDLALRAGDDARAVAAAVRFSDVTTTAGLADVPAAGGGAAALALGDYDGNGSQDLFVAGRLFRNELGRSTELGGRRGVSFRDGAMAAAFGDYDNDGRLDLYVATQDGGTLLRNLGDSTFGDVTSAAGLARTPPPPAARVLFVDLDQDGDLDLFLATAAGNRAYRNALPGAFEDATDAMGLAGAGAATRDAAFGDLDGDGRTDLVVAGADGRLTVFQNAGHGRFHDRTAASGLGAASAAAIALGDYDNDGFLDLAGAAPDGGAVALYRNRGDGTFEPRPLPRSAGRSVVFFDFDNDGWLDLAVAGGDRPRLLRNDGGRRFVDQSSSLPDDLPALQRLEAVDYDRDGDLDLVALTADGRPRLLLNDGGNAHQYVQIQLAALRTGSGKNNVFGVGSTLELRSGDLYQQRVVTGQVTHFGLGRRVKADVLRVQWPNGVFQTLYYPAANEDVLEQQILKGSCPFVYAWDGNGFSFVTDVMWRSALGMPVGIMGNSGVATAPSPASREYVRLPGTALVPRDGRYLLQITEELWETAYVDEVKLLVLDHPDSVDVFVDERFVPPGRPSPLRLYQVSRPRPAVAATDERGADLRAALRARDDVYVAPLTTGRYQGIAAMHDLILDFGDLSGLDSVFLFLAGWIYPTDASINYALAQAGDAAPRAVAPYLEVIDARGRWRRVADLSFPSGKNKTVIADLTGKFLSADRRVRIRTNMEIYWDQAFVAGSAAQSPVAVTTLAPVTADLHYRGYSRMYRKGGRYGPHWFAYDDVATEPRWEAIAGAFTRYGDVRPLLDAADDMYVIMAPGDEATVAFDATRAPPLPAGWTRDFVLYSNAWLKDADRNTATGNTVAPLPFHAMSQYPYGADEAYPADAAHRRYLERYNTRYLLPVTGYRLPVTSSHK